MTEEMPEPVGAWHKDGSWKKTHRVWIPDLDDNVQIELSRIGKELQLEEHGRDDGHHNRPGHGDKTLNEIQLSVCSRVYSGILMLNQFLAREIATALKHARALVPAAPDVERIKGLVTTEIDTAFREHHPELVRKRRQDLSSHRTLRFFVHKNRLHREAHYEESVVRVASIVVGMFVLESIINGSLFAQVVSTGLVGGAILAGMISAINILSGAAAGLWGWRNLGHCNGNLKILGGFVTLICHIIALFWNLFIAHFREVAEVLAASDSFEFDPSQLTGATIQHIQTHGLLGVESVPSWALLLLGIFIHFFAAKEGWDNFADRYPDYKKYDLRARTAHDEYEEALATLRDDVRESIEGIEKEAIAAIGKAHAAYEAAAELLELALERRQEVRDSENEWVGGGNRLLKTYREVNLEVRDKMTAPAYFETYPSADDYRRRAFDGDSGATDEVDERMRAVEDSLEELARLRDSAKAIEETAQVTMKEIHRCITLAMKDVDERIDEESLNITRQIEKEGYAYEGPLAEKPVQAPSDAQPSSAA